VIQFVSVAVIHVRTDPETDRALSELTAEGANKSQAIRDAILEAARRRRTGRLRRQAEDLAADPDDLAEMRRVQDETEHLRAW
jgi:hypothetical protein